MRTLNGSISFTGKAGSTMAAQISMPVRITVHASSSAVEPKLKLTNKPQSLSGGTGEPYAPFDIAVGKTVNILVAMRSFTDRLADPANERPIEIGCASASNYPNPGQFDLTNNVDFTNTVIETVKSGVWLV